MLSRGRQILSILNIELPSTTDLSKNCFNAEVACNEDVLGHHEDADVACNEDEMGSSILSRPMVFNVSSDFAGSEVRGNLISENLDCTVKSYTELRPIEIDYPDSMTLQQDSVSEHFETNNTGIDVLNELLPVEHNSNHHYINNPRQFLEPNCINKETALVTASEVTDQDLQTEKLYKGRPRKGRKRKYNDESRKDRQLKCQTNQDYVNYKGKMTESRDFREFECSCKCYLKVSVESRKKEFSKFWALKTYDAKCLFVGSKVTVKPVERKRKSGSSIRSNTRLYSLAGVRVCKTLFLQTLRISSCRVNIYLKKVNSPDTFILDGRGKGGGHNKMSEKKEEEVIRHIEKYPKYKSHYCREKTTQEFLSTETTLPLMYSMYKDEHPQPVSFSSYKKIFYSKFNLKRKPLKKDTCNLCDSLTAHLSCTTSENARNEIKLKHSEHLTLAKEAQSLMKSDLQRAKENEELEVLTFDLQKTMPLPRIPTNIVFYKRQLWLYNSGIHSGKTGKGYCYTWLEGESGRGAQEVGSCLKKHIKLHLTQSVKELILWSDSCGGQNRNIKIVLILKHILATHPKLEKVTFRYLVPGHSYLPNDSEFGDIECSLRAHNRVYTPDDYMFIIKNCRKKNKLVVTRMEKNDFIRSADLEKNIINRKTDVTGVKISWIKSREIVIQKNSPFFIELSKSFNGEKQSVNIKKRFAGRPKVENKTIFDEELQLLWPNGKPVSEKKLADIKSLMPLIPNDAKVFYKSLFSCDNVMDDIDGYDGPLDFEIENDEST